MVLIAREGEGGAIKGIPSMVGEEWGGPKVWPERCELDEMGRSRWWGALESLELDALRRCESCWRGGDSWAASGDLTVPYPSGVSGSPVVLLRLSGVVGAVDRGTVRIPSVGSGISENTAMATGSGEEVQPEMKVVEVEACRWRS